MSKLTYKEAIEILSDPETHMGVWEGMVILTSAYVGAIEVALEALGRIEDLEIRLKAAKDGRLNILRGYEDVGNDV